MPEDTENNTTIEYNNTPEPPVTVIGDDNEEQRVPSLDPQSDSKISILASSDHTGLPQNEPFPTNTPIHEKSEERDIWAIKAGEKPTDVIQNSNHNIKQIRSERDERSKSIENLDDADQHGIRVGYRSSYQTAERIKVVDNLKAYDKELRSGKNLSEDEVGVLLDKDLYQTKDYINHKKYIESQKAILESKESEYESKGLSEEDVKTLVNKHSEEFDKKSAETENYFNNKKEEILAQIKDKDGNYNSANLSIDQLSLLYNTRKETLFKEYAQDRFARLDESNQRYQQKRINEYMAVNPNWTPELAKAEQERDIAKQERDLYKNALNNNSQTDQINVDTDTDQTEPQDSDTPENVIDGDSQDVTPTPPEDENNENNDGQEESPIQDGTQNSTTPQPEQPNAEVENTNERQKNIEKWAMIAGVIAGVVGGSVAFAPTAVVSVATGLTSLAAQKLGEARQKKLKAKIEGITNLEEKAKFQRRYDNWGKVINTGRVITRFGFFSLFGSTLGAGLPYLFA